MADDRRCPKFSLRWPQRIGVWCLALVFVCCAAVADDGTDESPPPAGADSVRDGLPEGYEPPADPTEIMLLEKELLTPDERQKFKRDLNKYNSNLRNGLLRSDEEKTIARNGVRYRLNELTIPENRKSLHALREKLTGSGGELWGAGSLITKPDQVRAFRQQLMQIVVDETKALFDNNLYVRIQAALILGELNLIEDNAKMAGMQLKLEAFAPAAVPLCAVLKDPQQPQDVKVPAVLSLIRILRLGNPDVNLKREIANSIIGELQRTNTHWWYQMRLAEALAFIDAPILDLDRQPFIARTLDSIVKDPQRSLRVRVPAAWALGRHPLDSSVDLKQVSQHLVLLGLDLAESYDQGSQQPQTRRLALLFYLAFQPKDDKEQVADRSRKAGLLNAPAAGPAKEAYSQILPVVQAIWNEQPISPEKIQALEKWLQANGVKRDVPPPVDKSDAPTNPPNAQIDPVPNVGGGGGQ